jgi:hypothetical protein
MQGRYLSYVWADCDGSHTLTGTTEHWHFLALLHALWHQPMHAHCTAVIVRREGSLESLSALAAVSCLGLLEQIPQIGDAQACLSTRKISSASDAHNITRNLKNELELRQAAKLTRPPVCTFAWHCSCCSMLSLPKPVAHVLY